MSRNVAILLIFLAPGTADAQGPAPRRRAKEAKPADVPVACVRLRQVYVNRVVAGSIVQTAVQTTAQSGTVIWKHDKNGSAEVLTCAHGLDERGPVQLLISPDEIVWGTISSIDKERDLAVVACKLPPNITPVKLADTSPDADEDVTIIGFGEGWWDTTYAEEKTKVIGKVDNPQRKDSKLIRINAATRHGDSGGPLLYKGKLVGVHVRGDGRNGWEVPVEEVNDFLVDKAGWTR
jgi:S1-C subfamily serine protease